MAKDDNSLISQMDSYLAAEQQFKRRLCDAVAAKVPSTVILRVRVNGDGVIEFIKTELQEDLLGVNVNGENSWKP